MADAEAQLKSAVRAHAAADRAVTQATRVRDEAIRKARAAGISQARVMELTGLSRPRVNQIMRGLSSGNIRQRATV